MPWLKRSDYILIISLLSLLTYCTLFVFQAVDNNRLISWKWVFASVDPAMIFFLLIVGLIIAYGLSMVRFPERYPSLFLFGLSFIAGIIFWREPELILDSARYFTQAKHLEIYGIKFFFTQWGKAIHAWTDLPLVPFLYGLIFKFLGESRIYIQIFTTTLFSLTVVLTYLIGKTLWDKNVGFFAGMLLLGMPYLLTQVPLMLVDIPTMFFLSLSIFTFIKALEQGGARMILLASTESSGQGSVVSGQGARMILSASTALFLAFFAKYSTWLMLSVLVVIFLIYLKEGLPKTISRAGAIVVVAGIMIVMVVLFNSDVIFQQIQLLRSYQGPGLRRWQEGFISTFFFQIHPFITILAGYSFYAAGKKRDWKYGIICWPLLLIILCRIERARYIILALPMFALMAAYGLSQIKDMVFKRFTVYGIVSYSVVIAIFAYLPFVQKISTVNLKNAGEYLNSIEEENIDVFTLFDKKSLINPSVFVPMLDIFTQKQICFQPDEGFSLPQEKINTSSLRFTWEYKNPQYYMPENGKAAVVVISDMLEEVLPGHIKQKIEGYHLFRTLKTNEGIFRSKIFVRIYRDV